jgi:hypothetical protein
MARANPLRDVAFAAELAGVLENGGAIAVQVLDELQAGRRVRGQPRECWLSHFQRPPSVFAAPIRSVH